MGLTLAQRAARAKAAERAARAHERYVQRTYGLAPGEYDRMFEAQDGRCAICLKQPRSKRLSVDHNHETGKPRSLLCQPCNRGLRSFEFDIPQATLAAQYISAIADDLARHRQESRTPMNQP